MVTRREETVRALGPVAGEGLEDRLDRLAKVKTILREKTAK